MHVGLLEDGADEGFEPEAHQLPSHGIMLLTKSLCMLHLNNPAAISTVLTQALDERLCSCTRISMTNDRQKFFWTLPIG